ncbi:MAG: ATP-grasp domain-containing protein [Actinobacteria bacterium]|nr:ATP-grasp domain-containing protein [Actinomycetota bacterium]
MADRLLVLGAGPAQLGLLAAARRRALFVIAVDRDPGAPGFRYADRRAILSAEDEPGIHRLAEAEEVDGIIAPGIDWPVAIAARVAERLGVPHPLAPATAVLATSKVPQRQRLAEAGVPQPRWTLTASPVEGVELPCVVKAPDRQGQRGLTLVRSRSELVPAVQEAVAASRSGSCIIEELADGPEVTVNGFSTNGAYHPLTVTDRLTADPPAFGVALAHVWPSALAEAAATGAGETAARAVAALGIENGPTYTQLRVGADGPMVIEVAARLGGGHDAELCEAALGVDLNGLALDAALGAADAQDIDARPRLGGACTRFLVAPPGELDGVAGLDEARAAPGVLAVHVYRAPRHRFGPLRIGSDRAGAVLATGASRGEAVARAHAAADLVRFEVVHAETEVLAET